MAAILSAFQAASTNGTLVAVLGVPITSRATYSAADGVSADVTTPVLQPDAPPPSAPGPGAGKGMLTSPNSCFLDGHHLDSGQHRAFIKLEVIMKCRNN